MRISMLGAKTPRRWAETWQWNWPRFCGPEESQKRYEKMWLRPRQLVSDARLMQRKLPKSNIRDQHLESQKSFKRIVNARIVFFGTDDSYKAASRPASLFLGFFSWGACHLSFRLLRFCSSFSLFFLGSFHFSFRLLAGCFRVLSWGHATSHSVCLRFLFLFLPFFFWSLHFSIRLLAGCFRVLIGVMPLLIPFVCGLFVFFLRGGGSFHVSSRLPLAPKKSPEAIDGGRTELSPGGPELFGAAAAGAALHGGPLAGPTDSKPPTRVRRVFCLLGGGGGGGGGGGVRTQEQPQLLGPDFIG